MSEKANRVRYPQVSAGAKRLIFQAAVSGEFAFETEGEQAWRREKTARPRVVGCNPIPHVFRIH
jgi:hypothetical protein